MGAHGTSYEGWKKQDGESVSVWAPFDKLEKWVAIKQNTPVPKLHGFIPWLCRHKCYQV